MTNHKFTLLSHRKRIGDIRHIVQSSLREKEEQTNHWIKKIIYSTEKKKKSPSLKGKNLLNYILG